MPFRALKDASPASLPHNSNSTRVSDLPHPDPPTSTSSTSPSGLRATTAQVSAIAQPTLSQPPNDDDLVVDGDGEVDGDGDGSSIMGRAANIASTAKDLLGALWYGANEEGRVPVKRGHRRGASLG